APDDAAIRRLDARHAEHVVERTLYARLRERFELSQRVPTEHDRQSVERGPRATVRPHIHIEGSERGALAGGLDDQRPWRGRVRAGAGGYDGRLYVGRCVPEAATLERV